MPIRRHAGALQPNDFEAGAAPRPPAGPGAQPSAGVGTRPSPGVGTQPPVHVGVGMWPPCGIWRAVLLLAIVSSLAAVHSDGTCGMQKLGAMDSGSIIEVDLRLAGARLWAGVSTSHKAVRAQAQACAPGGQAFLISGTPHAIGMSALPMAAAPGFHGRISGRISGVFPRTPGPSAAGCNTCAPQSKPLDCPGWPISGVGRIRRF